MKFFIKHFIILTLVILFYSEIYSQSITWQRLYDGPPPITPDYGRSICEATNGNFYVAGFNMLGGFKGTVYKLKPSGDTIWVKILYGLQTHSITISGDGGCVVTGEPFTVKLDSNGNTIWLRNNTQSTRPYEIIKTSDGGYILGGRYGYKFFVLKIDSNGNLHWEKFFFQNTLSNFNSIIESHDNGFIVTGYSNVFPTGDYSFILKLNSMGDSLWLNQNTNFDYKKIHKIKDGYLIGGSIYDTTINVLQSVIIKTSLKGDIYYQKVLNSSGREELKDIKIIDDNRYLITADYDTLNKRVGRAYITDSLGNILHRNIFDYPNWDFCLLSSSMVFNNGDIGIVGTARLLFSQNWQDIFVARTDSTLFSKPIGIKSTSNSVIENYKLHQNYPNPFNPSTTIKFEIPNLSFIKITIYNSLGQEMEKLVDQNLHPGNYEVNFNGGNYSSGIYFYKLEADSFSQTKRMILIR